MEIKDEILEEILDCEAKNTIWRDEEIISKVVNLLSIDDRKSSIIFAGKVIDNIGQIEESEILPYFKDFESDILIFCNLFKETGYEGEFEYTKASLGYFTKLYYKYEKSEIQENDLKYIILVAIIESINFLKNNGAEKFTKVLLSSKTILLNFTNLGILKAEEKNNNIKIELDFNEGKFKKFLELSKDTLEWIYDEILRGDLDSHIYIMDSFFYDKAHLLLKKIKEASV